MLEYATAFTAILLYLIFAVPLTIHAKGLIFFIAVFVLLPYIWSKSG